VQEACRLVLTHHFLLKSMPHLHAYGKKAFNKNAKREKICPDQPLKLVWYIFKKNKKNILFYTKKGKTWI
jgi:hypothetical protein